METMSQSCPDAAQFGRPRTLCLTEEWRSTMTDDRTWRGWGGVASSPTAVRTPLGVARSLPSGVLLGRAATPNQAPLRAPTIGEAPAIDARCARSYPGARPRYIVSGAWLNLRLQRVCVCVYGSPYTWCASTCAAPMRRARVRRLSRAVGRRQKLPQDLQHTAPRGPLAVAPGEAQASCCDQLPLFVCDAGLQHL